MGLSLSGGTRKTRIGADPRNTQWANDTERFGHQQLVRMGWKPGRGLGSSVEGVKEHVKVKVKTDAMGLGKPGQQDQPTGLDVFQRILGKLNGTEEEVERQIEDKQRLTGLYMHFVPGGRLEGTVKDTKELKKERKSSEKQRKKAAKAAERAERDMKKKLKQNSKARPKSTDLEAGASNSQNEPAAVATASTEETVASATAKSPAVRGIRATRSRYIAMKRQATADSQSLKEILMQ